MHTLRLLALCSVVLSGCIPGPIREGNGRELLTGAHRLDKAYESESAWKNDTENTNIDYLSCYSWRNWLPESHLIAGKVFEYAMMASNTYDDDDPTFTIPGWSLEQRYTTWNGLAADLYLNADSSKGVVAYEGTNSLYDWLFSNFSLSPYPPAYIEAQRVFGLVREKYPYTEFSVTGHSLGGGLALTVSRHEEGVPAYVFNSSPRAHAWKRSHDNETYIIHETGEILYTLVGWVAPLALPDATSRRYNFADGLGGFFQAGAFEHAAYILARGTLLLATQGKQCTQHDIDESRYSCGGMNVGDYVVLPNETARTAFTANFDQEEALSLNPDLCAPIFRE
ncbi:MAG: hypothetical protein AAFP18_00085 [Bacteroidota bacterium]